MKPIESYMCPHCNGEGRVWMAQCRKCSGTGFKPERRALMWWQAVNLYCAIGLLLLAVVECKESHGMVGMLAINFVIHAASFIYRGRTPA